MTGRPSFADAGGTQGFSLVETLVALALGGLIMAALALVTGQWFPTWNAGFARVQAVDLAATALDRIAEDIAGAEFISADPKSPDPFFDGGPDTLTFVRRALGPASSPGLEIVRLTEATDRRGSGLLRARAPFTPAFAQVSAGADLAFPESLFVLRGLFLFSFAYQGSDGAWRPRWDDPKHLPAAVRVALRDRATGQTLALTTAVRLHITASPRCIQAQAPDSCKS
jgi:general secretion pathway protein J